MADSGYTGQPVNLRLPTPLDPATLNVWAQQLNSDAFTPILDALNKIIRYLNGDAINPPAVPDRLLTEDGDSVTLETGDVVLL